MTNLLAFGPVGPQELMIIFIIVLLLFGAKKIPELARGLGKSMGEFKRARDEFEDEIKSAEIEVSAEKKKKEAEMKERAEEKEPSEVSS